LKTEFEKSPLFFSKFVSAPTPYNVETLEKYPDVGGVREGLSKCS